MPLNSPVKNSHSSTEWLSCRKVLSIMICFGFMFNYMLRVNLTIAIVAMVDKPKSYINQTTVALTASNRTATLPADATHTKFAWNEYEQNLILGSFFWGYLLTELPGGRLAEKFGARRIFGYSMLGASLVTLLTPLAAAVNFYAVAVLRALLGLMLGATWPAIHPLAAVWIPQNERSKFLSNMLASSLGAAITLPTCGYLIDSFGWPSVFYLTGMISLVWSMLWFLFIYEKPENHPRITAHELTLIKQSRKGSENYAKPKRVPWSEIFSSRAVWAIIFTHGLSVFGFFTIVNQLPTYLNQIYLFNIKENGLLSSLPYLGKYLFAVVAGSVADWLLTKEKLTLLQIRKSFTALAVLTPGLIMLLQVLIGKSAAVSVSLFTLALTVNGAVTAGYLSNGLDIAPNFAGTIFGLANTLSSTLGFVSNMLVAYLTYQNHTIEAWNYVFAILFVTYTCGALIFLVFGQTTIQKWNFAINSQKPKDENIPLNRNP